MDRSMLNNGYNVFPTQQTNSYELASKCNIADKTTGNYSRYSMTEKVTENQRHVERGSRREGVRDEYKTTEQIKVGNEKGYIEYQKVETLRSVTYDNNISGTNNNAGGTKYLTEGTVGGSVYGHGEGVVYSGSGCEGKVDLDVDSDDNNDVDGGDYDYNGECDCDYDWDDYEDVYCGGVDYDDEY